MIAGNKVERGERWLGIGSQQEGKHSVIVVKWMLLADCESSLGTQGEGGGKKQRKRRRFKKGNSISTISGRGSISFRASEGIGGKKVSEILEACTKKDCGHQS